MRILHHQFLMRILQDIYRDPDLAKHLYFKGGTALYLFYDLPRFSTDLDFDISKDCPDPEEIFKKLKNTINKYGKIKDSRIKRNTILLVLSYEKYRTLIKIEASIRNFPEKYEIKNFFGTDIKLLSLDLICAQKLMALAERIKGRDLFDAYYIFLNKFPISKSIISLRMEKNMKEFWIHLKNKVEKNFNRRNVLHELGEVVKPHQKDWIRNSLKKEVIKMIEKQPHTL